MTEIELYTLICRYYGKKKTYAGLNAPNKQITFKLYGEFTFYFRYTADSYCVLLKNEEMLIDLFLNKKCEGKLEESSIKLGLKQIDDYCRLLLPDKFLKVFDEENGTEQ